MKHMACWSLFIVSCAAGGSGVTRPIADASITDARVDSTLSPDGADLDALAADILVLDTHTTDVVASDTLRDTLSSDVSPDSGSTDVGFDASSRPCDICGTRTDTEVCCMCQQDGLWDRSRNQCVFI